MDVSGSFFKVSEYFFSPRKTKNGTRKRWFAKTPKNGGVDDNFLFFKGMMFMEPFRIYLVYTCLTCQKKTNNTQGRELVGGFQIVLGVSPLGEMIQFEDDSSLTSIFRVCNMPLGGLLKVTPVKWYESFNLALVILAKKCIYIYLYTHIISYKFKNIYNMYMYIYIYAQICTHQ